MKKRVLNAVEQFNLLDNVKEVTVALSGGADSMALLYVLKDLSKKFSVKVSAAHFNHRIRGAEADRDEEFVKNVCARLGVELFCGSADVRSIAKERKLSLELAAREARYEFLESVAPDAIATAHTASDSLETALFNLARGTGIKGLCGIPAKRGRFIRPAVFCTRDMVEEYCTVNNIDFVTDSTNLCDDYSRNKLRHGAVPVLKEINPAVETAATRTFLSLLEDCDFLEASADSEYNLRKSDKGLSIENFDKLHLAVAKRVIMRFYESALSSCSDSFHINGIYSICLDGGRISLPDGMAAVAERGLLKIEREGESKRSKYRYNVEMYESVNDLFTKGEKINNLLLKNSLDCDKIIGQLVVRQRFGGDSIRLKNKNCTKTLKKLYNEYKIPISERDDNPVICDDQGVVWINGIGVADRCAVDEKSLRILRIKVIKD